MIFNIMIIQDEHKLLISLLNPYVLGIQTIHKGNKQHFLNLLREETERKRKGKASPHGSELVSYLDVLDSTHVHPGLRLIWIQLHGCSVALQYIRNIFRLRNENPCLILRMWKPLSSSARI